MTDKNHYKVSIVMATYNGEAFIKEQLESIINQSYKIYEIIIQDDCSTDGTWKILKSYEKRYPFIKCYQNDSNLRAHETFKIAFSKATGDYIAPSDQDDIWLPEKIDTLISIIGNNLMAHSQSTIRYMDNVEQSSFDLYDPYVSLQKLLFNNYFPGHAFLFDKSILHYIALTSQHELSYDHVIALYSKWKNSIVITDKCLQIWRRHDNVCTRSVKQSNDYSPSFETKATGYEKFNFTLQKLFKKEKSKVISNAFYARKNLFSILLSENPNCKDLRNLHKIAHLMFEQDFLSYIRAGFLCVKIQNSLFNTKTNVNIRYILGRFSFSFRYPFTFWYDMHNEKCL